MDSTLIETQARHQIAERVARASSPHDPGRAPPAPAGPGPAPVRRPDRQLS